MSSDSSELPEGRILQRAHSKGIVTAEDSSAPWHLGTEDCQTTFVLESDGSTAAGKFVCDIVDADGDVWWLTADVSAGAWQVIGGTGKYDGMEGEGTFQILVQFPDGRYSFNYEGSYRLQ